MKFDVKFKAKYKVRKIFSQDCLGIQLLDTEDFKCEVKDCCIYGQFGKVYIGDVFISTCMFVKSEKSGYLLKSLDIPEVIIPSTETELAKFISSQIKGTSRKTIESVISDIGINFIGLVNEDPNVLDKTILKKKQKEGLIAWCESHYNLHDLVGDAYIRGIAPSEVFEMYKRYGTKLIKMIENDPYALYLYGLIEFNKIDKIALKEGIDKNSKTRIAAIIFDLISQYEEQGSMAITKETLHTFMISQNFEEKNIWDGVDYLLTNDFIDSVEFENGVYYGKRDNLYAERMIADYIKNTYEQDAFPLDVIKENFKGAELNKQQKEAVFGCLSKKISLLVGGPGTGKTFTIKRIIRTAKFINPKIRIAPMAPTGKAASRMVEMIGLNATTIHAALGIAEGDDIIHKDGMVLDKDLIIIDEASMIDEILFSYFCRHISKNTQVILVGDTGQLPSVNAGNLLQSLSKVVAKYELTTICRQNSASAIVVNAHHIRNKEFDKIEFNDSDFRFIETTDIVETAKNLYKQYTKKVDPDAIMILSPQHNKDGTDQINARIQEENKNPVIKSYYKTNFKRGDRVIQTKNNKKLEIHNGDQGEVVSADDKTLSVWFDGKGDPIDVDELANIELSYAITVHKSQGSEANVVIMIFNKAHMFTLSNKLIYTALTRTKTTFVGIGDKKSFYEGCKKKDAERISLITEYIGHYHIVEEEAKNYEVNNEDNWMFD